MKSKIIIEYIKDIGIDGYCIKQDNICVHDVTLIYDMQGTELIKSITLNYYDIKYILNYLNKTHNHFNYKIWRNVQYV